MGEPGKMSQTASSPSLREKDSVLEQVLGYLNFSCGAVDVQLLANLNRLYAWIGDPPGDVAPYRVVERWLQRHLQRLSEVSPAFRDSTQAAAVLDLTFQHVLPGYLEFHRDLLFHQTDRTLFGPFFLGRVFEAVLQQGPPWDDPQRIARGAIRTLNDFVGHRPVAVLENRKLQPYEHEWVRPVPLYIQGAGVAVGPYHDVVRAAIEILETTDPALLRAAHFDPQLLEELAMDPRAYDFDHPVNKRPNYHFGQWDPHRIDNQGRYRRYVVQQLTLDALMSRVHERGDMPYEEAVFEAAAVLAGTILMGSGVSGSGPDTHDSTVTLATLLPDIAAYRDAFYEQLFARVGGQHAQRLRKEAIARRQPFGGARQHLNTELARRRAAQLEHVHMALLFARMGYPEAAVRQAGVIPCASARMRCQIDCRLTAGHQAIQRGQLQEVVGLLDEVMDLIHRAIECGAMIDPWNILGFDANFSLFPAVENSIHDHRADELIELMEQVFELYSRAWSDAAARDEQALCQTLRERMERTARWWHQFAAHEVSSVEASDAMQTFRAAEHVADAMRLWHQAGAASGDLAFWSRHAEMFQSAQAYALVVNALLDRGDPVASMALLIHWLSQAERVGLKCSDHSFPCLAERWLVQLLERTQGQPDTALPGDQAPALVKKFFDYLEANAEHYWHVPEFTLNGGSRSANGNRGLTQPLDDEDEEFLFSAAYEDVVYRDSTDDGIDDMLLEFGTSDDELENEAKQIGQRLSFLTTLARLWSLVATGPQHECPGSDAAEGLLRECLPQWIAQAARNRDGLERLVRQVQSYRIPLPRGDLDSLIQYDRRRVAKDALLEQIIGTCVETNQALCHMVAAAGGPERCASVVQLPPDQSVAAAVMAAMMRQERPAVRRLWPSLISTLQAHPLLYVPIARGGDPQKIIAARSRQQLLEELLSSLPRLGLLNETRELLETARRMERSNPVGPGAVTEFDELFEIGYKAIVDCLLDSATSGRAQQEDLLDCLERATQALLVCWLAHSRTLRLSVLEKVKERSAWQRLVDFIRQYGSDLFTQRFLQFGNLRAILHQGVETWLEQLQDGYGEPDDFELLHAVGRTISMHEAVEHLTLVLEAILENYVEYRDYNSTTTQSDRGELLYTLLDFLRLRADYDRVAWNLKPIVWAHEMLARRGMAKAAQMWRRSLSQRIAGEANKYAARLSRLQKKYAMRMPTVADRIGERFVRPLLIDRIRALIRPAIEAAAQGRPSKEFQLLEKETERLMRKPTGVGLDVPAWIAALEEELQQCTTPDYVKNGRLLQQRLPQSRLSLHEARRQIDTWLASP